MRIQTSGDAPAPHAVGLLDAERRGPAAVPRVAPAVLLDVPQVVAAARLEPATAPPRMQGCELEVDQDGRAVDPHDDVLLLVQIVVTDARGVELGDPALQEVEEVEGQGSRAVERRPPSA